MRILIAPDKFKGSLTAAEVSDAVEAGLIQAGSHAKMRKIPLADGGEGTSSILTEWFGGDKVNLRVSDPLGRPVDAFYGISPDGVRAFIEMSAASGLELLQPTERNPLRTTTYGTGELIRDAIRRGVSEVVLGIGGSATNDLGTGMAQALGYTFLDDTGRKITPSGQTLRQISTIVEPPDVAELKKIQFTVLSDVTNPLYGPTGAAHVFAPQKGADQEIVRVLDLGLRHLADLILREFGIDLNFQGAGASGGLGAGSLFFLDARLIPGSRYILQTLDIENEVQAADFVVTGEGRLDDQSLSGKVVGSVLDLCSQYRKPCVIICGKNTLSENTISSLGNVRVFSLASLTDDETHSILHARELIATLIRTIRF